MLYADGGIAPAGMIDITIKIELIENI